MKTQNQNQKVEMLFVNKQQTPSSSFLIRYYLNKQMKGIIDFAKFSYLAMVMILLLCAVVELKHIFNVDIFPGIDTPFDNAYYAGKEKLGGDVM